MDLQLEEAARALGASTPAQCTRDVWLPQLAPTTLATGAISCSRPRWAHSAPPSRWRASNEVVPITIYNEFTNYANFALAASLSIALGLVTWAVLVVRRARTSAQPIQRTA